METTQENKTEAKSIEKLTKLTENEVIQERQEQERTTIKKEAFLRLLKKTLGVVDAACKGAGISREIAYQWRRKDPEFGAKWSMIVNTEADEVEEYLKEAIMQKDLPSVRFYLSRVHPKYKMKIQHEAVVLNLYGHLSEEQQLDRLRGILTARGGRIGERKLDLLDGGNTALPENGENPQQGGEQIKGSGNEPGQKGDFPVTEKPSENNGDNHQLPASEIIEGSESEGIDNE